MTRCEGALLAARGAVVNRIESIVSVLGAALDVIRQQAANLGCSEDGQVSLVPKDYYSTVATSRIRMYELIG